jgi:hypothetical protein
MGDFQRPGPLHVVPRLESNAPAFHRRPLPQHRRVGPKSDFVPLARKALAMLAQGGASQQIDQLAIQTDMSGLGHFLVTKQPHDIGAFRTMGLRNLLSPNPTSTTAHKRRCGTRSTITTRAAFRIRFSMVESFRLD